MKRYRWVTVILLLSLLGLGAALAGMWATPSDERNRGSLQSLNDPINDPPSFQKRHPWAIFFGTGWTEEGLKEVGERVKEGKLINPFTGEPFDRETRLFAFGQKNAFGEAIRVVTDHLEIHLFSSWEELRGYHFDFALCHSNGCTNAIDAIRRGFTRVEYLFALGTDWTSKHFPPGDLKGTRLLFFATQGDPIWKIPAPNWAPITENTPGLALSIPFDHPWEIAKGMGNLLTQGRADLDRFPVTRLDPPPGQSGTLLKPFRPHAIFDSYFPAIGQWMKKEGSLQKEIAEKIRRRRPFIRRDEKKKTSSSPPGPPECPWCGDGGGGGGGGTGGAPPSTGEGIHPSRPGTDPRGGVFAEIEIDPKDFRLEQGRE